MGTDVREPGLHLPMGMGRFDEIVSGFAGRRILVVGDLMLDEYVWGQVNRISPEAPVMVVEVNETSYALGGAGNVANNIQAMGGHAVVCGVVGNDPMGQVLRDHVAECGGSTEGLVVTGDRPTTVKTRIVAHSQQVVRVDREKRAALDAATLKSVTDFVERTVRAVDAVLLSDYAKGALGDNLVEKIIKMARDHGKPLTANLKPPRVNPFHGASFLTLNVHEAERASNETISNEADLFRIGRSLQSRLECGGLLITRGADGIALFTPDAGPLTLPARRVEVYDVAGAGDTVIASATLALAAGGSYAEAAAIGNVAGNAKVTKLGVTPVSREEMRRFAAE